MPKQTLFKQYLTEEDGLRIRCSQLFALVSNLEFELPTLEAHHHAAEFIPGDFPAIHHDEWHTTILGLVPFDPSAHDAMICNLQSEFTFSDVLDGKGSAHLINEPSKQNQKILLRIAYDLKLIARRVSIPEFERVERDAGSEQMRPKMKNVWLPIAIGEPDGFELEILEFVQPVQFGGLRIEAPPTELTVAFLDGTEVDDVVVWHDLTANTTPGFSCASSIGSVHSQ